MAVKQGKTGFIGFLAFLAMILNAIYWLCDIVGLEGNPIVIIKAIASLSLVVVALVVAYDFAKKQDKVWRIIYWLLTISTICAIIIGAGVNFVR